MKNKILVFIIILFSMLLIVYVGNMSPKNFECYGNTAASVVISPDGDYQCIRDLRFIEL